MTVSPEGLEKGQIHTYYGGSRVSPYPRRVKIVWLSAKDVHYVRENDRHNIVQTPIERFVEVINANQPALLPRYEFPFL